MYRKGKSISPALQERVLHEVLARIRAAVGPIASGGPRGSRAGKALVAFDLDSTLLDNRPRQALILREWAASAGVVPALGARPEHITSWSITDALRNMGLDSGEARGLAREARAFWRERFFTSEYCVHDHPIPGAVRFAWDVLDAGAQVAYVTGRHTPMGAGTIACFAAWGFPLPDGERVHLVLKPSFDIADDAWKASAREHLPALGNVIAAFDNEPAHANCYVDNFPAALTVHMATDDSGRPVALRAGVPSIADFTRRADPRGVPATTSKAVELRT